MACALPSGAVANSLDCNDADAALNPNTPWYIDAAGDGFGVLAGVVTQCATVAGRARVAGDCDDAQAAINPGATEVCDGVDSAVNPDAIEVCDGVDNDCDTLVDDDDPGVSESSKSIWYLDNDGDLFGSAATAACDAPAGHVGDGGDCDDGNDAINPGATEVCDGIDNNCNTLIDDADPSVDPTSFTVFFIDADGDGFGSTNETASACLPPLGFVLDDSDCDDDDENTFPGAPELCDERDNDCDDVVDNDVVDVTWYFDGDFDGFGTFLVSVVDCADPGVQWVQTGGDCDDTNPQISPLAIEVCDGIDNNCDSQIDNDPVDGAFYFLDDDLDGFGDPAVEIFGCEGVPGFVANGDDCDDANAQVNPASEEICNGIDDDCDVFIDEDLETFVWYIDADEDGFGSPEDSVESCDAPDGYVDNADDCDDTNPAINPDAVAVDGNGVDEDCTGEDPLDTDEPTDTDDQRPIGGPDDSPKQVDGGCNCASGPGSAGWLPLLGLALVLGAGRRHRRASRAA